MSSNTDPFSPENKLIFMTAPLTGTTVPSYIPNTRPICGRMGRNRDTRFGTRFDAMRINRHRYLMLHHHHMQRPTLHFNFRGKIG
ncbi:MAG: hypothetical protein ACNA7Y_06265 [Gammaproteobacteria bacterium]